ncbi:MAG: Ig-like domain-containing protein, partial [Patescibacteria group bacterium]
MAGKTGSSVTLSGATAYPGAGAKTGSVTVTSGSLTKAVNCSNSVTVYQPVVRVETVNGYVTSTINEDDTVQLYAKYYKFGIAQGNPTNASSGVEWSSLNQSIATINNTGLVTAKTTQGTTYINIGYTDSYGNTLLTNTGTRARVDVTTLLVPTISFVNPNTPNNPVTGQDITFTATDGIAGNYSWSAPGGSPNSGTGATFVTKYATTGNKTVTVTSGKSASAIVTIITPVFDVGTFQAVPSFGGAPLTSTIHIGTGGNIIGETTKTNYSLWWNCSYTGTNITTALAQCNSLPTPIPGQCVSGTYGAKCD